MPEEWRDIIEIPYKIMYEVSNRCRIRRIKTQRILKPCFSRDRDRREYVLQRYGKRKRGALTWMLRAFHPLTLEQQTRFRDVDHMNMDSLCDHLLNARYATHCANLFNTNAKSYHKVTRCTTWRVHLPRFYSKTFKTEAEAKRVAAEQRKLYWKKLHDENHFIYPETYGDEEYFTSIYGIDLINEQMANLNG